MHCRSSALQAVLAAAQPLPLHPEQALLHSRLGNHPAALAPNMLLNSSDA
jgi:hypothetical protein